MRRFISTLSILTGSIFCLMAQTGGSLTVSGTDRNFTIVSGNTKAEIMIDEAEALVVKKAVDLLNEDIYDITEQHLEVKYKYNKKEKGPKIIAFTWGEGGKKSLYTQIEKYLKEDFSDLEGKWEAFRIETLSLNEDKVLLVVGSDRRGTAYGLLEISRMLGVSPWKWWADVRPEKKRSLVLENTTINSPEPSIKYRGIFINDEDWGMHPWAGKTFEPEVGDMGPRTYSRIFELLLRLRANTIWPAMHECTKPFFSIEGNMQVADTFGIMISNSHCEPMLRTNTGEWKNEERGAYNYFTNKENVLKYWEERVIETKDNENIYTIGMRGIHDGRMEGAKNVEEYLTGLREVLKDQRDMLSRNINTDLTRVHQIFIPYKEVQEVYDAGLEVPEDVTLIWCDDNYGYIRRLSDEEEQKRSGGSGVYYHVSYWGRPHDYLWLPSTQPALVWYEMQRAYAYGARTMWILNVGDGKPSEYLTNLFLDMAWDIKSVKQEAIQAHMENWLSGIFGKENGKEMAGIMDKYYELAFIRRPEFMGWSRTEPTTQTKDTEFNAFEMGDEIAERLEAYGKLDSAVVAMESKVSARLKDAYFELVEYPVRGAAKMNEKHLYAQMARTLEAKGIQVAAEYGEKSEAAYNEIKGLTKKYNEEIAGGKWNLMMSMTPRNLPVFNKPVLPESYHETEEAKVWIEGHETPSLPYSTKDKSGTTDFMILDDAEKFVKIYDAKEIVWLSKPDWMQLKPIKNGEKETIYHFGLDEKKMIAAKQGGIVEFKVDGKEYKVAVEAIKPPIRQDAYETNRAVIIPVENHMQRSDANLKWKEVKGLGYSRHAMGIFPLKYELSSEATKNPCLEYTFYTTSSGVADIRLYFLPTHPADGKSDLRYAISLDDNNLQTASIRTYDRDENWKNNVLRNQAVSVTQHVVTSGKHTLRIYAVDPGLVLDQIMIDFDVDRKFYVVPNNRK